MNGASCVRFTPVVVALLLTAAQASAQDATVGVGASTAVRPAAAPAAVVNTGSDHDMWVGHVGVGWFGSTRVPVGVGCCAGFPLAAGAGSVETPAIGIRYWATPMIGIDLGLGLGMASGSTTNAMNVSADKDSRTAFLLHAGVPIAIAGSNHFSFQITPELDVGFGSGTIHAAPPVGNTDQSGFLLQAGARAGAEIYFGFIGLPALALDGSVGLFLTSASGKNTNAGNSTKDSIFFLGTSNITNPWDIFRQDVAARYYF